MTIRPVGGNSVVTSDPDDVRFNGSTHEDSAYSSFDVSVTEMQTDIESMSQMFDSWISRKKQSVIGSSKSFVEKLSENTENIKTLKSKYSSLIELRGAIHKELGEEKKTVQEEENKLQDLTEQKAKLETTLESLKKDIATNTKKLDLEKEINKQKEARRNEAVQKEFLEIEFLKCVLSLDIAIVTKDVIKFTFSNIDVNDLHRQFIIAVNMGTDIYKIVECNPYSKRFEEDIRCLNTNRDLCGFLKKVRKTFIHIVNSENV